MRTRGIIALLLLVTGLFLISTRAYAEEKFRLKPGAKGKVCMNCHVTFIDKVKSPFVHTPVKTGECSGCHNPHTSSHGKLLAANAGIICSKCHPGIVPEKAKSTHKVVVEGKCIQCHDPHAAPNKNNLLKEGNALCYGCHKDMGDALTKVKFKHHPVEKGCLTCHNPHASSSSRFLLKTDVPSLCVNCHKTDKPAFSKQHMNYPVAKARCTTCHNPHGSDRGGILYATVHKPLASKMCNQCHEEPTSATPFKVKRAGFELCKACHSGMINDIFSTKRLHWPLVSKQGCLNCHTPHASAEKGLLKGPMRQVCGSCHADSIARQEISMTKHSPIRRGQCTACHAPHASENVYLMRKKTVVDLCGGCHDWQKHSTHPLGEKITDPRNKNLTVNCLSCHRSHGTENKNMLHYTPISEMCTQCHTKYKR
ncbi:MAG: cytochrome C [Alphaproteobacteria bacterium]|uniref:Cytochrome C n=1 Tax=Candidatus Nitrobium versatile TaxID=2884831 RepID=A0A953J977_9BACT|nr:cytochrome C [Candidatus Nitrobium versatile]